MQAARAAGMRAVVALWGYRLAQDDPSAWGADAAVDHVDALLEPAPWGLRA